jgi:hypothetical protein
MQAHRPSSLNELCRRGNVNAQILLFTPCRDFTCLRNSPRGRPAGACFLISAAAPECLDFFRDFRIPLWAKSIRISTSFSLGANLVPTIEFLAERKLFEVSKHGFGFVATRADPSGSMAEVINSAEKVFTGQE